VSWRTVHLVAGPGFRRPAPSRAGLQIVDATTETSSAVSYDTRDLRLARWQCTLRHDERKGWAVAVDGDDVAVFTADGGLPPEAIRYLSAYHRGQALRPLLRVRTNARRLTLQGHPGRVVRLDDQRIELARGRRVDHVRRLSVSAPKRSRKEADAVVRLLHEAGARTEDSQTLLPPEAGLKAPPAALPLPKVNSGSGVDDVIRAALATSVIRLIRSDGAARLGHDPEGVHQARVATRRLRSDLRTFAPLVEDSWAKGLRRELSELARDLGDVRDADILLERLADGAQRLEDPAAAASLLAAAEAGRDQARQRLIEVMESPRYGELIETLIGAAAEPHVTAPAALPGMEVLPALVHSAWLRLKRQVRALPKRPSDEQLHLVRIAAKRVRYAAEAVAPCVGAPAARFATEVEALQTHLGDLHDAVVAATWLGDLAPAPGGGSSAAAAELIALELRRAAELRAGWERVWERAGRKSLRRWM
jgi:CHAD domain-containing protein